MNGHELIYKLNQLSAAELDYPVHSEGCDCIEAADGIRISSGYEPVDGKYKDVPVIVVTRS